MCNQDTSHKRIPLGRNEVALVGLACALHLALGFANLGAPSLWHDEAVQVQVAKSIAETGLPLLPSGRIHPVAPVADAMQALFILLFGDAEAAVRAPSVLFGAANVLLTFFVLRPLVGRTTAIVAAFGLALSPWSVAWSRQARFYALQQTLYLVMLWSGWRAFSHREARGALGFAAILFVAYLLAIGTALHSVIFVSTLGAYAFMMAAHERRLRSRWTLVCIAMAAVGLVTLGVYFLTLPFGDFMAIFHSAGIGFRLTGPGAAPRWYYLSWLSDNLSLGCFMLAMLGFVLMWVREGRRGLFAALGFWAPVLVLTFLIAYRRHRFMYFAFPCYVAAFSYGAVQLARFLPRFRTSKTHAVAALVIALFGVRLGISTYKLVGDSLEVAAGADITLATRHPQWREPCRYVRDNLDADTVVITTTYMPTLYYVGRVDEWYPSLYMSWESWEAGAPGIKDAEGLDAYLAAHPKGYFLAEWFRFAHYDVLEKDRAFVSQRMTHIAEASSGDVQVYAWGIGKIDPP